ncbi:cytochrome c [Polaribacter sp. Hel1_85]|uniref:cytochrome c n=1 Tax=Polaribacter sp. Hel1_85 TaxID=1250005 RepID=UPI00052CF484|nr:cytochrome c [Polaribacter sp. Hel1_85]KGL64150.1 hypothetical protein PHEL85_1202 [Polaribacter sp. Hel1_85]
MKNKLKFTTTFIIIAISIFFASCISNVEEQLIDDGGEDPITANKVSFADDVKPIIDARCLSCHSAGANSPELSSYDLISANASRVKDAVASSRMPQGGTLTAAQIKSIVDWVDEGALDN